MSATTEVEAAGSEVENLLDEQQWTGKIFSDGWVDAPETGSRPPSPRRARCSERQEAAIPRRSPARRSRPRPPSAAWAATPFAERVAVVRRAGELMERHRPELINWLIRESGAIPPKADHEITRLDRPARGPGRARLPVARASSCRRMTPGRTSTARRIPLGVVGVITPWNFPYVLAMRSVGPALALGNAVVLKPDANTPVTGGVVIARLFEEAGLPEGVLHVLPGDGEVGQALVADPNVRMISFTGSTATGRLVGETAGRMLKRLVLEMGGNSPLVVLEDADIAGGLVGGSLGLVPAPGADLPLRQPPPRPREHRRRLHGRARRAGGAPAGRQPGDRRGRPRAAHQRAPARARPADRRRERRAGREGARRRDERRSLLRADGPGRRHARDAGVHGGDLRPGRADDAVPRRRRGGRARQRHLLRA